VKAVNEVLGSLSLEKHPDKTFIGRIERGFDFLGFHFSREGLTVAKATIERFVERAARLYEQERRGPFGSPRFGMYVRRWLAWARAAPAADVPPMGVGVSQVAVRSLHTNDTSLP